MKIESYQIDATRTREFLQFLRAHYSVDEGWLPPPADAFMAQFAPGFEFYRHPGNRFAHFVARVGDAVIGHLSATVHSGMRDDDGTPVGALGFYECVDDPSASGRLFDAGVEWLQAKGEVRRIWAPMNFDLWHGHRCMTRGFEYAPYYGEPRNKPYYPAQFEGYGFAVRKRWSSVEVVGTSALETVIAGAEARYRDLYDRGFRFVRLDPASAANLRNLHAIEQSAFSWQPGIHAAFLHGVSKVVRLLCPGGRPALRGLGI